MLNQKKVEIFLRKFHKSLAKQFLEIAYYNTPSGVERLESTCMLLIAIGESIKGIDKTTDKKLLSHYPDMDWKGVMGMRDIIAHHYFDLDGEVVFNVVKIELPNMLQIIRKMINDVVTDNISL